MFTRNDDGRTLVIVIRQLVEVFRDDSPVPEALGSLLGGNSKLSVYDALEGVCNDYETSRPTELHRKTA